MRWLSLVFAFLALACTHPSGGNESPAFDASRPPRAAAPLEEGDRPIAAIATRNEKVTVFGGSELRVSVSKLDGTPIASRLTLDELAERHPELDAIVRSAVVSNAKGTYLDARGPDPVIRARH